MPDRNQRAKIEAIRKKITKCISSLEDMETSAKYTLHVEVTKDLLVLCEARLKRALNKLKRPASDYTPHELLGAILGLGNSATRPYRPAPGPKPDEEEIAKLRTAQEKFVESTGYEWTCTREFSEFALLLDETGYAVPNWIGYRTWTIAWEQGDPRSNRKLTKLVRERWRRIRERDMQQ